MSGKVPPRGPRALLGSLPASSSSSTAQPPPTSTRAPSQANSPPTNKRIGAVPPTGPRSLSNGNHPHSSSNSPFRGSQGRPKHPPSGHAASPAPGLPLSRPAPKPKKVEIGGWTGASSSSSSTTVRFFIKKNINYKSLFECQANGWHETSTSAGIASGSGLRSKPITFSLKNGKNSTNSQAPFHPPQPLTEPPPPPH